MKTETDTTVATDCSAKPLNPGGDGKTFGILIAVWLLLCLPLLLLCRFVAGNLVEFWGSPTNPCLWDSTPLAAVGWMTLEIATSSASPALAFTLIILLVWFAQKNMQRHRARTFLITVMGTGAALVAWVAISILRLLFLGPLLS